MLAILKEEVVYTNAHGLDVVIPKEVKIKVDFLIDGEFIGTYNDESFELSKDEFAVLQ